MLQGLASSDWERPTPCPGWSVLGLASHLVGGDLSFVAWQRDGHRGTLAPGGLSEDGFIDWLDVLQLEWVHAARRLSPRLVVGLLGWLGAQLAETVASQDPTLVAANVSWASARPVPLWLDHARELSERWVHRQQILESLGVPEDLRPDLAEPVLDGLRWAYPYRLGAVPRPAKTCVVVAVAGPEVELRWNLISDGADWHFSAAPENEPVAELRLNTTQAWRSLTSNYDVSHDGAIVSTGDDEVIETLLRTRAVIGHLR